MLFAPNMKAREMHPVTPITIEELVRHGRLGWVGEGGAAIERDRGYCTGRRLGRSKVFRDLKHSSCVRHEDAMLI